MKRRYLYDMVDPLFTNMSPVDHKQAKVHFDDWLASLLLTVLAK